VRPTSTAGSNSAGDVRRHAGGFVLIDALAAMAVTFLALALVWPAIPHGTTWPRMAAIATEIATFLKTSRTDALLSGRDTLTVIDRSRRTVVAGDHVLTLPADVDLSVLSAGSCRTSGSAVGIVFRADGTSCGAVVRISRGARGFRIRVNWYTGHVAILRA